MGAILEIKNLSKSFPNFRLKEVSFFLNPGYITGFIGPNGAGKSTTIKLIMNLLRKDAGEIKVFGLDHLRHEKEIKNRIGFVYDENCFYEELTVSEMKNMVAGIYKTWDEGAFQRCLKKFDLPTNAKIKELSRGMKMKFSLAVALSHRADLLIMDEPTSGLDPLVRSELLEILAELIQDEQKGIFFSTHVTSDLDKIADYITLINDGRILFSKPKDELLETHALVKGGKELLSKGRENCIGIREHRYGFEALVDNRAGALKIWGDRVAVERPTLEEIMLYYTRRDNGAQPAL